MMLSVCIPYPMIKGAEFPRPSLLTCRRFRSAGFRDSVKVVGRDRAACGMGNLLKMPSRNLGILPPYPLISGCTALEAKQLRKLPRRQIVLI